MGSRQFSSGLFVQRQPFRKGNYPSGLRVHRNPLRFSRQVLGNRSPEFHCRFEICYLTRRCRTEFPLSFHLSQGHARTTQPIPLLLTLELSMTTSVQLTRMKAYPVSYLDLLLHSPPPSWRGLMRHGKAFQILLSGQLRPVYI